MILLRLFLCLAVLVAAPKVHANDADALSTVDLSHFVGTWFEIASIPQFFQRGCLATKATYTALPNGNIDVFNQCHKGSLDGKISSIHGKAWPTDSTDAKLNVQFFWPFYAAYWIFDLDDARGITITGSPDRSYLWILSRSAHISDAEYAYALGVASENGFDVKKLVITPQP